jgi:hypothetical protein
LLRTAYFEVEELELDGLDLSCDDGLELAPVPAEPLVSDDDEELEGLDEAPPPDWLFVASEDEDEELEGEELEGEELMEPLAEPDGLDGVVAPEDDEDDGEVEDGLVVEDAPVAERSLPRSHAVSRLVPSARETAIARVESLMGPPWLGTTG